MVNNGTNVCNYYREPFDWNNEKYNTNLLEPEPKTVPCPDIAAELTGKEIEQNSWVTAIANDEEADDDEERDEN